MDWSDDYLLLFVQIVKTQLDKLGYNYLTAENGKEAVDLIQTQYENSQTSSMDSSQSLESKLGISLVLMDCAMVRIDGTRFDIINDDVQDVFINLGFYSKLACYVRV